MVTTCIDREGLCRLTRYTKIQPITTYLRLDAFLGTRMRHSYLIDCDCDWLQFPMCTEHNDRYDKPCEIVKISRVTGSSADRRTSIFPKERQDGGRPWRYSVSFPVKSTRFQIIGHRIPFHPSQTRLHVLPQYHVIVCGFSVGSDRQKPRSSFCPAEPDARRRDLPLRDVVGSTGLAPSLVKTNSQFTTRQVSDGGSRRCH